MNHFFLFFVDLCVGFYAKIFVDMHEIAKQSCRIVRDEHEACD